MHPVNHSVRRIPRTRDVMAAAFAAAGLAAAVVSTSVAHVTLSDGRIGVPACAAVSPDRSTSDILPPPGRAGAPPGGCATAGASGASAP